MERCLYLCNSILPFSRKKVYGGECREKKEGLHPNTRRL